MEKKLFVGVLYMTIFVTFAFIILTIYLEKRLQFAVNQQSNKVIITATTTITDGPSPTITPTPVIWNTYIDKENGFSVEYPTNRSVYEKVSDGYHSVDFYNGCLKIISATEKQVENLANNRLPWTNIQSVSYLEEGQSISFVIETWNLGQGKTFNLTNTFKKQKSKHIGGVDWYTYLVTNNYENHGLLNEYYTFKNKEIFYITSLTNGPCWVDEAEGILKSFKFIQ